ncbi:hypothetical protein [Parapedobacter koreensis]|uniref:hypothetical protein n=1 Tax=Parapedobacter koreensis TaxID=332977 RepID=UPI0015A69B06|nr:hypothetical protein [Parapedobacter koreensis]
MYSITLLSSFHKLLGKCNPDELYKIIEEIQPEIIFEELSPDTFSFVYADDYIPNTIEATAIKKYLRCYSIKHFPVDTYPIYKTDLFFGADEIAKRSAEYVRLWKEQVAMIKQEGHNFLNSDTCSERLDKIRVVEETVLSRINDLKLLREHKSESELHDKRETEMLRNIYNYSKQHLYNKAMFICGAEHREPIKAKIQEYEMEGELKLNWAFYNNL